MDKIPYKGQELLPPRADIVFKALFTKENNRDLLASFIGSVLGIEIAASDISIADTELAPPHQQDKLSRLDIRANIANDSILDIEIQFENEGSFKERSIYYLAKLYTGQMKEKMPYNELVRTIGINIMNFKLFAFPDPAKFHSCFRMQEVKDHLELTDIFEVNFIELPKVPSQGFDDPKTMWAAYLSARSEEVLDMLASKSPVMEKAVQELKYISADEQARYEYDMRQKAIYDYHNAMITRERKGREEGLKEGVKITAKNALAKGLSIEMIAEITGLSLEEIKKL